MADRHAGGEDSDDSGDSSDHSDSSSDVGSKRDGSEIMKSIQEGLKELWTTGALSDVTLQAGTQEFKAHRAVLAAASPFFMAMFSGVWAENEETKPIELKGLTPLGLQHILTYIYTGALELDPSDAFEVLMAADHLQVLSAVDTCVEFMSHANHVHVDNCVDVLNYAKLHHDKNLEDAALACITEDFKRVLLNKDHVNLEFDDLCYLLNGGQGGEDAMEFGPEVALFYAVVDWLKHEERKRMKHQEKLMGFIRFSLMSIEDLDGIIKTVSFMTENTTCQKLISDAQAYHQKPVHQQVLDTSKCTTVRSRESVLVASPDQADDIEAFALSPHVFYNCIPETTHWVEMENFPALDLEIDSCIGEFCSVVFNGYLIVLVVQPKTNLAGVVLPTTKVSIYLFDPRQFEWSSLPSYNMKNNCTIHTAVGCGEELFVFMNQGHKAAEILIYNFNSNTWKSMEEELPRLNMYSVCTYEGEIFVFLKGEVIKCYKFSPKNGSWALKASCSRPRRRHRNYDKLEAHVYEGNILVVRIHKKLRFNIYKPDKDVWDEERLKDKSLKWPAQSARFMCGDNLFSITTKGHTYEYTLGEKFNEYENLVIKHRRLPIDVNRGCLVVPLRIPKNKRDPH